MLNADPTLVIAASAVVLVGVAAAAAVGAARRTEARLARAMQAASTIVSGALAAADPLEALADLAERVAGPFEAAACAVFFPAEDGRLRTQLVFGYEAGKELVLEPGQGIAGAAFQQGEPIIVRNARKDPRYVEWAPGVKSIAAVPLRVKDRILGVLTLQSTGRRFRERDLAILVPLADQIAAALENLELRVAAEGRADREQKIRNELQAISAVVMAGVASASDLDAALHSMIKEISARMGWESLAVVLYADDGLLHTRAYYGNPLHSTVVSFEPGKGIIGTIAKDGAGRLVGDVSKDPDYLAIVSDTRSEMCAPLYSGEKVIGVLNAESPRLEAFSEDDFRVLNTLARQMAIVIERARLADLERVALDALREADQLKDDFVATVSHELRTPLTSIKGYAQTLLARGEVLSAEDRTSFLEIMVRHCDRLARIVETLLLVSRLEAGEIGSKPTYMSVGDLIRDAAEAAGGEERVTIEADHTLGVVTDHFRVHHILRNLLENACKYSDEDSPVLARASIKSAILRIEVLDQGEGIPLGSDAKIFERFSRLSDPGRSRVPGTGLGLYIARRFARDLGGDLFVERVPEEGWSGARLVFALPNDPAIEDAEELQAGGARN
jgi:K+-sensing histidine kinase KdpD